jgi:hypothetical protein
LLENENSFRAKRRVAEKRVNTEFSGWLGKAMDYEKSQNYDCSLIRAPLEHFSWNFVSRPDHSMNL